ncbi:MAG: acylneuraminate cytidylyltransferase family protein [Planctomycetota bacterium]
MPQPDWDPQRVLGIILARGGSRGIPGKNLRPLAGQPLITRAVDRLQEVPEVSRVVVSTDDPEIARVAREQGADVPFLRPARLAEDDTPSLTALSHAVHLLVGDQERAALTLLYQATSPCCGVGDLSGAIAALRSSDAGYLQSVTPVREHPHWMGRLEGQRLRFLYPAAERVSRRQDLPALYRLNGAISIYRTERMLQGRATEGDPLAYVMEPEASLDLDDLHDWEEAERFLARELHGAP